MAAPTALDNIRTGTPDGTSGTKIPTVTLQEDATLEAPGGIALSDRIPAGASADRTVTDVDTATDLSTSGFGSTGLINVNNRGALVVAASFEGSGDGCTVRIVYYDASSNPLFVGPPLTFTATALQKASGGHYVSEPQIVESYGASKVRPYVVSKTDAVDDLSLFVFPL